MSNAPANVHLCSGPNAELDYDTAITQVCVRRRFESTPYRGFENESLPFATSLTIGSVREQEDKCSHKGHPLDLPNHHRDH
ncbi:uncharacterized protein [Panulirus ornatus]|uniref:uncharacterized protein isoform X2 n=1 Tax=Panulirus ornatus TaxID=150431 RepID=UPI003A8A5E60